MQGGSLYTLEGVPVASHNDTDLKIGWGGERKSPVPGLWGAYWAYLHRPFNGPSPGFQFLPALAIPTAAYQALLATNNSAALPVIAQRILGGSNRGLAPRPTGSVDNDWRGGLGGAAPSQPPPILGGGSQQDCTYCMGNSDEGEVAVMIGGNFPKCGRGYATGYATVVKVPPGGCVKVCRDSSTGLFTYEVKKPGESHCRNAGKCCPVNAYCNGCEVSGRSCLDGTTTWDISPPSQCWAEYGAMYQCCCNKGRKNDDPLSFDPAWWAAIHSAIYHDRECQRAWQAGKLNPTSAVLLQIALRCVIFAESSDDPTACNKGDCGVGLMQLTPKQDTNKKGWDQSFCADIFGGSLYASCSAWQDPAKNIQCGTRLVCEALARCQSLPNALRGIFNSARPDNASFPRFRRCMQSFFRRMTEWLPRIPDIPFLPWFL